MKILEIGTGKIKGHRFLENAFRVDIDKDADSINLLCDCHKLPFKDNCYDIIYLSHVLEHCINPYNVIKELKRVCKKKLIIKIPNCLFFGYLNECDEHIYSWNKNTIINLCNRFFDRVEINENFNFRFGYGFVKNVFYYLKTFILIKKFKALNEIEIRCYK